MTSSLPDTVPELLSRRAMTVPMRVALVVDGHGALTFGTWEERSNASARGLLAQGVRGGDRIALVFDNAHLLDYAVSYLAVLKVGAVAVPLAPRFSGPEMLVIVRHCAATGIVRPLDLLGPQADGWTATPAELEAGRLVEPMEVDARPQDLAEILYTSGTTGAAKGVACSHETLLFDLPPEIGADDGTMTPFLHAFPMGTNAGQECLRVPLRVPRKPAVVLPTFEAERCCAAIAEHRIARLQLVPAMAHSILSSGATSRHDVSSVERVTLSSAPTPPSLYPRLAAAFPRASIWNVYTSTEAGAARTLFKYDGAHPASVGRPVGRTELRVVGPEGEPAGAGEAGEVLLRRRDAPTRTYFRDPEATRASFTGGWLRTGDLGYLDDDGYLHLVDRKDDVIISGGFNVSSLEVEAVLHEHPLVVEAAVFGTAHGVLGEDVTAAVVVSEPIDSREIQKFARQRLADHKCPRRVFLVDELPHNPSGKLLKRELRERFRPEGAGTAFVAPRTSSQETVAAIWTEILGQERIGIDDDFFEHGGHSLAAAQIASRLGEAFAVAVPLTLVFDHATVADQATAMEALAEAARVSPSDA